MENNKEFTTKEAKEVVEPIVKSVKLMMAFCEIEDAGSKDLCLDVLIKELEKMRPAKCAGVSKDDGVIAPKPVNDLMPTAAMMCSEDYKERFKAEYYQTKIRYDKLHKMCVKYEAGTLDFTPSCELSLLKEQKAAMGKYLNCLEIRAQIEGVAL